MKPILEIQHISKKYKLRGQETPYLTLRDAILGKHKKQEADEFWALNDVSFDVYPGESIGIIGRNGAGKSTLLKILSRITPPTKGKIISRGRIASLLEVGTGFHAELTGRENIFLNGSILGLRKQEIKAKFDEIVDFAGVEKFIDTPLKHYSSGMQLRLAFAVAAHLEPEILIIDEVLAVGDAEFQKKSLGKMEEVTKQGRTVLFVSHNMAAVQNLCSKGVLLNEGEIILNDNIDKVIKKYRNTDLMFTGKITINNSLVKMIFLSGDDNAIKTSFDIYEPLTISVEIASNVILKNPVLGVVIKNEKGENLVGINNNHYIDNSEIAEMRHGVISLRLNKQFFFIGRYYIDIFLGDSNTDIFVLRDKIYFNIESRKADFYRKIPNNNLNNLILENVIWKADNYE